MPRRSSSLAARNGFTLRGKGMMTVLLALGAIVAWREREATWRTLHQFRRFRGRARMAALVDAYVSHAYAGSGVRVRIPLRARPPTGIGLGAASSV